MTELYEVIIIGGGGSGLTAALYSARADFKTVLFERNAVGGQITITDEVENYPGFPEGITGFDIAMKMEEQAKKHSTEIVYEDVKKVVKTDVGFSIETDEKVWTAKTVVLAMGAGARKIHVPGEVEFTGKGVSYCAVCDAPFFRNKTVAVIGGGDSAIQEALYLTKFAEKVYVVHRRDELRAGAILAARAKANEKMNFLWDSVVNEIKGEIKVDTMSIKNVKTDECTDVNVDGVFVFIGHDPNSSVIKDVVGCDAAGYVLTDDNLQTSVEGMFACGEIRSGATRQLVSACGEGCRAALSAEHYLNEM